MNNVFSGPGLPAVTMTVSRKRRRGTTYAVFAVLLIGLLLFVGGRVLAQDAPEPADELVEGGEPHDVLVTNVFFDTFILDALSDLSLDSGVPILADATVSGFVTLEFFDVPLPLALEQLALPGGFTFKWMDGYYLVGSAQRDGPLFHLLSVTERVKLKHLQAQNVPSMLSQPFRDLVRPDTATNSVIVSGESSIVERIVADIEKIDVAPYQIQIDALITEVNEKGRRSLGLDWSWTERVPEAQRGGQLGVQQLVGSLGFSFSGLDRLFMQLRDIVEDGDAKIRANPSLVALEGEKASMFVGKTTYYRIVSGSDQSPTTRLEAIEAGVTLELEARVADDGTIVLHIAPGVDDVQGEGTDNMPVVGRRRVNTTVRVQDGETIGIGGLLQEIEVESHSRVPLLGSLPIFGRLFSSTRTTQEETEVLIFITPHIMRDDS